MEACRPASIIESASFFCLLVARLLKFLIIICYHFIVDKKLPNFESFCFLQARHFMTNLRNAYLCFTFFIYCLIQPIMWYTQIITPRENYQSILGFYQFSRF